MTLYEVYAPQVALCQLASVCVCLMGDHLLTLPIINSVPVYRALTDSLTHGLTGAMSWIVVTAGDLSLVSLTETSMCAMLASVIDVDHFIAAQSLHLKDALSLAKRPALHNSSLVLLVVLGLFLLRIVLYKCFPMEMAMHLPWIVFVAWSSHHIRDAHRRGLWFAPFGSTPPLPLWLYLAAIMMIPLGIRIILVQESPISHIDEQTI